MGFLDEVLKQSGGLSGVAEMVAKNPQIVNAVVSMLSTRDTSVGGSGGLGGLVSAFQQKGLGDVMSSWISTGPNPPVSADQLKDVLGSDVLGQFASKAGVPHSQAGTILASLLPAVIDHLTPNGQVPETNALEGALGGLLSGFMKR
jgi:uncharacterized protein YidB (DUF937 family)